VAGAPLVRHGLGHCYRTVMVDSVASSVTGLPRELISVVAFVEGAAQLEPGVQAVPTPLGDVAGRET
jgi:hypothetical protein